MLFRSTFTSHLTVIEANWLQDVNNVVYNVLGNGTTAPTTGAAVMPNIGALTSAVAADTNLPKTGGLFSGYVNYRGPGNITSNTVYGAAGFAHNTAGQGNTAIGYTALEANTTGTDNTGIGAATLFANTTGNSNTAVGTAALAANTTGQYCVAMGLLAGAGNTTANNNVCIGSYAGFAATTGGTNTFIGAGADTISGSYSNSTALGYGASVTASNQMVFGNASITNNIFKGKLTLDGGSSGEMPFGTN